MLENAFLWMYPSISYHCVVIFESPKVDLKKKITVMSSAQIIIRNFEHANVYRYSYTSLDVRIFNKSSNIGKMPVFKSLLNCYIDSF